MSRKTERKKERFLDEHLTRHHPGRAANSTVYSHDPSGVLIPFEQAHGKPRLFEAGVPLAALLKTPERFRDKTAVVVLCGANMSLDTLKTIL